MKKNIILLFILFFTKFQLSLGMQEALLLFGRRPLLCLDQFEVQRQKSHFLDIARNKLSGQTSLSIHEFIKKKEKKEKHQIINESKKLFWKEMIGGGGAPEFLVTLCSTWAGVIMLNHSQEASSICNWFLKGLGGVMLIALHPIRGWMNARDFHTSRMKNLNENFSQLYFSNDDLLKTPLRRRKTIARN